MRRLVLSIVLLLLTGAVAQGCGFGLADDTGKPIPGQYWPWVCADGGPAPDAGCPLADAASAAGDGASRDAGSADR